MGPVGDALSIAAGATLTLLAVYDAVQTILHPDLDGWLTKRVNRWVWAAFTSAGRVYHEARDSIQRARHSEIPERSLRSWAGPTIVTLDIAIWMSLPIFGYALVILPAFPDAFSASEVRGEGWSPVERVVAAVYYSATTFTTLGYGDFAPQTAPYMVWAILAPLTGLLIVGLSIAYVIAVFEGVDARDAIMLRVYAECGVSARRREDDRHHGADDGRLDGVNFVIRAYRRDPAHLADRLEAWAADIRSLHGHLYRFHGLAFYLRTRAVRRGPERLMRAFADATLAARILAVRRPDATGVAGTRDAIRVRDTSEHLQDSFVLFAEALLDRGGFDGTTEDDEIRRTVQNMAARLDAELGLGPLAFTPEHRAQLHELASLRRRFLDHVRVLARDSSRPAAGEEGAALVGDAGPVG